MKTKFQILLVTLVIVCGAVSPVFSQSLSADKVPANITDAFKSKFPKAEQVKWVKSGDAEYSVFFAVDKWKHFAMFNGGGKCFEDDAEMSYTELPAPIKAVVTKDYKGYSAKKSTLLKEESKENIYELFLVKDKESYTIKFTPEGGILKNSGKKMLK